MTGTTLVPPPPDPFNPQVFTLTAGSEIFRVYSNTRKSPVEFNPGPDGAGRFSFFGDPLVPVLYAAQTETAAVCETLLHDIPVAGGELLYEEYRNKVQARIVPRRNLRLASFLGTGLRTLGIEARNLTDTTAYHYGRTLKWAEAAHQAGLEGVAWMSKRENSAQAYMFFGDRVAEDDFEVVHGGGLVFAAGDGFNCLVDLCGPLHIEVMPPLYTA